MPPGASFNAAFLCWAALLGAAACSAAPEDKVDPPAPEAGPAAQAGAPEANVNQAAPQAGTNAAPGSCADRLEYRIDPASFANNGAGRTFAAARLERFRQGLGDSFRSAANAMCAQGQLNAAAFAGVRSVLIRAASGATEPGMYVEAEGEGPATLVLEYVFAEQDLALPERADLQAGLLCWSNPGHQRCQDRGD